MANGMGVKDFAKYVIDNLGRATLANAMNIADKLDNENFYDLREFVDNVNSYVGTNEALKLIGYVKVCKVVSASYDCIKKYDSDKKYNKRMVIDNYIIELWRSINE